MSYHGNVKQVTHTENSSTDLEDFKKSPDNRTVKLNNSASVKVKIPHTVPNGYPPVTMLSWRRILDIDANRTLMPIVDERAMLRQDWLVINPVLVNDTGIYQYIVSNGYCERSSPFIYLKVVPSE